MMVLVTQHVQNVEFIHFVALCKNKCSGSAFALHGAPHAHECMQNILQSCRDYLKCLHAGAVDWDRSVPGADRIFGCR